jgi:tetratricopeptide (TPR) repeat protein
MIKRWIILIGVVWLVCGSGFSLALADSKPSAPYHNPAMPGPSEPAYWLDRGGLFATYGNYTAAIKAYRKALDLDPKISEAYFSMGLALAELGRTDQAFAQVERAIVINPNDARYYYGRARIFLITGQAEKAQADFDRSATMGHYDAIVYLSQR